MLTKTVVINNPTGLHLRPAGNLCKEAVKYKSKISFNYRNNNTNAKSVLSVLAACVKQGESIELVIEGDDEEEAMENMVRVIEEGLGETEEEKCRQDSQYFLNRCFHNQWVITLLPAGVLGESRIHFGVFHLDGQPVHLGG